MKGLDRSFPVSIVNESIRDSEVRGYGYLNSKFRSSFDQELESYTSQDNQNSMSTGSKNVLVVKGRAPQSSHDQCY